MTNGTIEFTRTEIPAKARSGRTPLPNPFMDAFPADDEALSFDLPEGKDSVKGRRVLRQIRQAAKHHNRTGRCTFVENEDGSTTVTTWTVERVSRPNKASVTAIKPVKKAPAKKTAAKKTAAKRTTRKAS